MGSALLKITAERLDLDDLLQLLASDVDGREGAVTSFLGLVRGHNLGRQVVELVYEAYEPLALRVFERITAEVGEHWPSVRLALHHRIGRLPVGEASVAIAAASPHRAEAFAACRYTIERVKQIAPIWKREIFDGGDAWVEGALADPDDPAARATAFTLAQGALSCG